MKKLLDIEKSLYKDIFMTIAIVIISIPVWLSFDVSALNSARMYDNYNYVQYEFLNNPSYSLKPVSDEFAMKNYETQDIVIYNNSNTAENYSLILKINKNSTNDPNNLKININYQIDYLKDYFYYEDENSFYYLIDNDDIIASSQKYTLSLWNDELASINNNDILDYEFIII